MTCPPLSPSPQSVPAAMRDLTEPERLIVWAFRHWVTGHVHANYTHWSLVWSEFARTFSAPTGKTALASLEALVRTLCSHARRRIQYHEPCCPILGADEFQIIAMLAACQGREGLAAAKVAERLVAPDGVGDLLVSGAKLAALMEARGHVLPNRRAALSGGAENQGEAAGHALH